MSTLDIHAAAGRQLPLSQIENELTMLLNSLKDTGEGPVQRARMSNLVIFNRPKKVAEVTGELPGILAAHPARVLLLIAVPEPREGGVVSSATAWCQNRGSQKAYYEKIILAAHGPSVDRLPYLVRELLVGDLPINLWWASEQPPPLAGPLLRDLAENAQQVIYDSIGWLEPAVGVVATATWLGSFTRGNAAEKWRCVADLNWRRLKPWRRFLGQVLDPATAPGALDSIAEVELEHGPHAVVQAWELASWLASRLQWRVQGGRVDPNVEMAWQAEAPHGPVRIRIRRLAEGPSEVRRLRIACAPAGQPMTLAVTLEEGRRLTAIIEGSDTAPRTMTVHALALGDLVGSQLSDRERDPVFYESMTVAQVMAESLLG
jgi:glucose-6-phosphate dehydrogenase assembly protein OpcA